eukprot:10056360-Alexandrium_andersonii.AAC.1
MQLENATFFRPAESKQSVCNLAAVKGKERNWHPKPDPVGRLAPDPKGALLRPEELSTLLRAA